MTIENARYWADVLGFYTFIEDTDPSEIEDEDLKFALDNAKHYLNIVWRTLYKNKGDKETLV